MTFEEIVRKSQHALKKALVSELKRMGYRPNNRRGFLYAKGNVPVLLVAHLDTVHREPVKTICYSPDRKIVMSPQGIGGDDRAGVFMILEIIKKHRCHVLFCEEEEVGGVGATAFVKSKIRPRVNYIVELDRHGSEDAVFYDCCNPDFTEFVCGFGFQEDFGSFSDISILAPGLGIAAVNLSTGYFHEHTLHEYVNMKVVEQNIRRVSNMVSTPSDRFEYIEAMRFSKWERCGFGSGYSQLDSPQAIPLMPLPESSCIRLPGGELRESDIHHLMDEAGKVYEYLFDLDAAVKLEGHMAMSEHGLPIKFRWIDSEYVEVVPPECVFELEQHYWGLEAQL